MEGAIKNPKDKWIPWYFVAFFTVIAILDGIFVYIAVSTHTGVVTENAYEKGLAFNARLEQAENQPNLNSTLLFENNYLRWKITTPNGQPLENATALAKLVRPVQDGHDFEITLSHAGSGIYEAKLELPFKGLWKAHLQVTWDNQRYQASHNFTAP